VGLSKIWQKNSRKPLETNKIDPAENWTKSEKKLGIKKKQQRRDGPIYESSDNTAHNNIDECK